MAEQVCNSFCLTKSLPKGKGKKEVRSEDGAGRQGQPSPRLVRDRDDVETGGRRPGSSEAERAPRVVQAVGVGQADVAAGSAVLGVAGLHPEDALGHAGLDGDGKAAHAAADAGERGGVDADHA